MTDEQTTTPDTEGDKVNISAEEAIGDSPPMLVEARSLAERIEEGNKKSEKLLKQFDTLIAEQALAGTSGGRVETVVKEETPKEYTERIEKEMSEGLHNG